MLYWVNRNFYYVAYSMVHSSVDRRRQKQKQNVLRFLKMSAPDMDFERAWNKLSLLILNSSQWSKSEWEATATLVG